MKTTSRRRIFIVRFLLTVAALSGAFLILDAVHDYPQTRLYINNLRNDDSTTKQRPWLLGFYFLNEAGSGLKFLITGKEKHMAHYPSPTHIVAARLEKAENGDWQAQLLLAKMYHNGQYVPQSSGKTLYWLNASLQTAPPEQQASIATYISQYQDNLNNL